MRSNRTDWWNEENPEKELAFKALLELAKRLKRQPVSTDLTTDEETRKHLVTYIQCYGSYKKTCLAIGMYLRSHPEEAVGMDASLWQDGEYKVVYVPMAERVRVNKTSDGHVVSFWHRNGQKKPPRQVNVKPAKETNTVASAGASADANADTVAGHEDEVQKQVAEQVLRAAAKAVVTQKTQRRGGGFMPKQRYTDRDLLMRLRKFYWAHGRFPVQTEHNRDPDLPSYGVYRARIGTQSQWEAAIEAEFGSNWRAPVPEEVAEEPVTVGAAENAEVAEVAEEPSGDAEVAEELDVRLIGECEVTAIVNGKRVQLNLNFGEQ